MDQRRSFSKEPEKTSRIVNSMEYCNNAPWLESFSVRGENVYLRDGSSFTGGEGAEILREYTYFWEVTNGRALVGSNQAMLDVKKTFSMANLRQKLRHSHPK